MSTYKDSISKYNLDTSKVDPEPSLSDGCARTSPKTESLLESSQKTISYTPDKLDMSNFVISDYHNDSAKIPVRTKSDSLSLNNIAQTPSATSLGNSPVIYIDL